MTSQWHGATFEAPCHHAAADDKHSVYLGQRFSVLVWRLSCEQELFLGCILRRKKAILAILPTNLAIPEWILQRRELVRVQLGKGIFSFPCFSSFWRLSLANFSGNEREHESHWVCLLWRLKVPWQLNVKFKGFCGCTLSLGLPLVFVF